MGVSTKDVYVDPVLTQVSIKYTNDNFIADKVFPIVNVTQRTGYYYVYDTANLKKYDGLRADNARANRIEHGLTKTAYGPLLEHCLEEWVPYDMIKQARTPIEPRTDAAESIAEALLVEKEYNLATDLADTAIVTNNTTLSGTSQFSDFANSDPFDVITTGIETVKKASVKKPNTIIISGDVWAKLRNHPDLLERIKYTQVASLKPEHMTLLFPELTNVLIADAVYDSTDEGQAASLGYIWGKHVILAYVNPTPKLKSVSAGYTLTLEGERYVDRWDEQAEKREVVRTTDYYEQKLVAASAIYLIKNAVA